MIKIDDLFKGLNIYFIRNNFKNETSRFTGFGIYEKGGRYIVIKEKTIRDFVRVVLMAADIDFFGDEQYRPEYLKKELREIYDLSILKHVKDDSIDQVIKDNAWLFDLIENEPSEYIGIM